MARQKIIVVFDTNALYQDQSPVHFVRKEIAELLRVHFVDVEVKWYVPGPVRKERESQLYRAATKLRHSLQLIEELTAASLNLDDEALLGHVKARISEAVDELGIVIFPLNLAQVDWGKLTDAAFNRKPPFSPDKEKGFKDALVAETLYQIVKCSLSDDPDVQIVFVTEDTHLQSAVTATLKGQDQIKVLSTVNELTNHLNSLSSQITEPEMKALRDEATRLFTDPNGPWFNDKIEQRIRMSNDTPKDVELSFSVEAPTFRRKDGRIFWSSRVLVKFEYDVPRTSQPTFEDVGRYVKSMMPPPPSRTNVPSIMPPPGPINLGYPASYPSAYPSGTFPLGTISNYRQLVPRYRTELVTVKYDVFWNAALTDGVQREPKFEELRFVESSHPQLSAQWEFDFEDPPEQATG